MVFEIAANFKSKEIWHKPHFRVRKELLQTPQRESH